MAAASYGPIYPRSSAPSSRSSGLSSPFSRLLAWAIEMAVKLHPPSPWRRPLAWCIASLILLVGIVAGAGVWLSSALNRPSFIDVQSLTVEVEPGQEPMIRVFRTILRPARGGFRATVYEDRPDATPTPVCHRPLPGEGPYFAWTYSPQDAGGEYTPSWAEYTGDRGLECYRKLRPVPHRLRVVWAEELPLGLGWREVYAAVSERFTPAPAGRMVPWRSNP